MENLVNNIATSALNKKGGTFVVQNGIECQVKHGFWVGGSGLCYIIPYEFIGGAKYLKSLIAKILPKITTTAHIGVWYNEETNAVYIEPVLHFTNKNAALDAAFFYNQIAIYDIANNKDINL